MGGIWGCLILIACLGCSMVAVVKNEVEPAYEKLAPEAPKKALAEIAKGASIPTNDVLVLRSRMNQNPWEAMGFLEEAALLPSSLIDKTDAPDKDLLRMLAFAGDFSLVRPQRSPAARPLTIGKPMEWARNLIKDAGKLRAQAVSRLTPAERQQVFGRGSEIVKEFGPQEELNDAIKPVLEADREFVRLARHKIDWGAMIACESRLLRLADLNLQQALRSRLWGFLVKKSSVPGVKGRIIAEAKTPEGWIIIGSSDNNVYDIKEPVALIIDEAGDDVYKGVVASPADAIHGISAILDLNGDDTYQGNDSAFATGRLGCALIVDAKGNDRYNAKDGGIGVGLGGVGMVVDREGNDVYTGSNYSIGVAIAGIGAVVDHLGNDSYTCSQFSIGLGGPCGSAGVFDLNGSDTYRCGFVVGSGYNAGDAPNAKPGDANYQYDAFGMGFGMGRRLYPFDAKGYRQYTMAGGFGMMFDAKGNDHYYASNFALACGYFFGVGCFVEIEGDDRYDVARYGLASGAHYAMGMFIDGLGNDVYRSIGPTYNCGCAWDHSAFLFADYEGNDTYDLTRSSGLGRADIGSWAVAFDLEGNDWYKVPMMPATNSQNSLSAFFDDGGTDAYEVPGGLAKNGVDVKVGNGGVFLDREK